MPRSTGSPREALLDAAERLFAIHGVANASLRDVAAEAGQRNNSAVAYHFGDRAGLAAAVLSRSMSVINEHRFILLDQVDSSGTETVEELVDVLVTPLAVHVESTNRWYGRFLSRNRADRISREVRGGLPESEVVMRILKRLAHQIDAPVRIREARLDHMMNHYTAALAGWEWARDRGEPRLSAEELRRELVATSVAMVTADAPQLVPKKSKSQRG